MQYATFDDVLKNDGKEFSGTVDGEYVAGIIDAPTPNNVTLVSGTSSVVEPGTTSDVEFPKYYYIKKDSSNPLWKKYIDWLNKEHSCRWTGDDYVYYGYDGRCDCHMEANEFHSNAEEITLEFWNIHMGIPSVPDFATEYMVSYDTASAARMTTAGHTNSSTGIKTPEPADLSLRTATGASTGNWHSIRVDGNDPLRMTHDAARFTTPTSIDDSFYESYRQAGKAHNVAMNQWVDGQSLKGLTPSHVFVDEAVDDTPKKTSRYSSMLDLI